MTGAVIDPADYLSEQQVLAKWPMLSARELKKARKNGSIYYYDFRAGPHYTAEQIQAYIDDTYLSRAEPASASRAPAEAAPGPAHKGLTPELAAAAAELLASQIGRRRKRPGDR